MAFPASLVTRIVPFISYWQQEDINKQFIMNKIKIMALSHQSVEKSPFLRTGRFFVPTPRFS